MTVRSVPFLVAAARRTWRFETDAFRLVDTTGRDVGSVRAQTIGFGGFASEHAAHAAGVENDIVHMLARTATSSVLGVPQRVGALPRRPFQSNATRHAQRRLATGSQADGASPTRPAASVCVNG